MLKSAISQLLVSVFKTTKQCHHCRPSRKGRTELLEPRTLLTAGARDTSLDADGIVTTTVGSANDHANRVAIQSDGKTIAAGHRDNSSNWGFALVRYNTDGTLGTSFDGGVKRTTAIGSSDDIANSVTIQSERRIIVAEFPCNECDVRNAL